MSSTIHEREYVSRLPSLLGGLSPGLFFYYSTSLLVILGVLAGHDFMKPGVHAEEKGVLLSAFANWDGRWYRQILEEGYSYDPSTSSTVAFFPAFPFIARGLTELTGCSANLALLLVAHVCLIACFVLMAAYTSARFRLADPQLASWITLALGLWPTTFFFRMAYSESSFLLVSLLAFHGMERNWSPMVLALVVGLATAVRPVGVALIPPLALHFWNRSAGRMHVLRFATLLPLTLWGLLAYMVYQWLAFGEPLAFALTQENWRNRPAVSFIEKAGSLLALEPIWSVFDPSSPCYWHKIGQEGNPFFSLHLANPLYFLITVTLVSLGAWKRWLSAKEVVFAAGLLFIPYVTRSHEMCMGGMGRFAAVVFPQYLVMGQIFTRISAPIAAALLAICGFFLGCYSALFAAGYRFF